MCNPTFIAPQFRIAKTQKQPRYPSKESWKKKLWYKYSMKYYSTNKSNIFCMGNKMVQLETIVFLEISQSLKNEYFMLSLIQGNLHTKYNITEYTGKHVYAYIQLEELYNGN